MATQDVFSPDKFNLSSLTAALVDVPHLPSQLGDAGIFEYSGIATLTVQIEKEGSTLALVQSSPRGGKGASVARRGRNLRSFVVPHIQLNDAILADEVAGVRQFGTESTLTPVDVAINRVVVDAMRNIDLTMEYHRINALKGILLDADGTTIYNLFTEFGVSQNVLDMQLDQTTTDVRGMADTITNMIEDELGGLPNTGAVTWCGRTFWQSLITHKSVKETYLNQAQAAQLRGATTDDLDFGGIRWKKYRGAANGTRLIGDNDGYVQPLGVPGLLLGRFAPGDWLDTVNTIGLPAYARPTIREDGKGVDIEIQSNPLHLLTRPRAVIKVTI